MTSEYREKERERAKRETEALLRNEQDD